MPNYERFLIVRCTVREHAFDRQKTDRLFFLFLALPCLSTAKRWLSCRCHTRLSCINEETKKVTTGIDCPEIQKRRENVQFTQTDLVDCEKGSSPKILDTRFTYVKIRVQSFSCANWIRSVIRVSTHASQQLAGILVLFHLRNEMLIVSSLQYFDTNCTRVVNILWKI